MSLIKFDSYIHTVSRMIDITKLVGNLGMATIEYGRQKSEVIWPRNTPPSYIEEIIKLDFFKSESDLL